MAMKSSIAASYSLWHCGQRNWRITARSLAKLSTAQAQRGQIRSQSISNRPCGGRVQQEVGGLGRVEVALGAPG